MDAHSKDTAPLWGANAGETRPVNGRTAVMAGGGFANRQEFEPETVEFVGEDNKRYFVNLGDEIGKGGEGVVVLAEDEGGKQFAAKVYGIASSLKERKAHSAVLTYLFGESRRDPEFYRESHLMPVISYGKLRARGLGERESLEYNVVIMPKCECLRSDTVSVSDLKRKVLPQIAKAIHTLHGQRLVHRDVKPDNIYAYGDVLVLGDYGIATLVDEGDQVAETKTLRGTIGYRTDSTLVHPSVDWYAFGYTLWTLYNGGVHPLQDWIDSGDYVKVHAGRRLVPFVPKTPADEGLGNLIYGLTTEVMTNRLGYDAILQWIRNPEGFVFAEREQANAGAWTRSYSFGKKKYSDGASLARALGEDWEKAREHLYGGNELVNFFGTVGEQELSTELRRVQRDATAATQAIGLAKSIFLISGSTHTMMWRGRDVSLGALAKAFAAERDKELQRFDEALGSGFVEWALTKINEDDNAIEPGIINSFKEIELCYTFSMGYFARRLVAHLIAGGGPWSCYGGCKTIDDVAELALGNPMAPGDFYARMKDNGQVFDLVAACAPFYAKAGKLNELVSQAQRVNNDALDNAGLCLLLMDSCQKGGCALARRFTATYGPDAGWFWMGEHEELYVSIGEEEEKYDELFDKLIENLPDEENGLVTDSVAQMAKKGERASVYALKIIDAMDDAPLAYRLGVRTDAALAASVDDALVCSSFFGKRVPRGFARQILNARGARLLQDRDVQLVTKATLDASCLARLYAQTDEAEGELSKKSADLGNRAMLVLRIILDVAGMALLLFMPSLCSSVSTLVAGPLGAFCNPGYAGILAEGYTRLVFAVIVGFLALDAGFAMYGFSRAGEVGENNDRVREVKTAVLAAQTEFADKKGHVWLSLSDPAKNESRTFGAASSRIDEAASMGGLTCICSRSLIYKIAWHCSQVLAATLGILLLGLDLCPHATADFVVPFGGYVVVVLIPYVVVYGYALLKLKQSILYSSFMWLGTPLAALALMFAVVLAIVVAVGLVYAVIQAILAALAVMVGIGIIVGVFFAMFNA